MLWKIIKTYQWLIYNARKGKTKQRSVKEFDRDKEPKLTELRRLLVTRQYRTSPYTRFKLKDPKERDISRLPYWPDRICHWAIINIIRKILVDSFISQTYNCIEGRGVEAAFNQLQDYLGDQEGTRYCLKLDIRKFCQSVNNEILKKLLRRKFKDPDLLWLLDEIIDSDRGLPLGNLMSQYLANFYLTGLDHWVKQELGVKYYMRYADDIVILGGGEERTALDTYAHQQLPVLRIGSGCQIQLPAISCRVQGYRLPRVCVQA